MTQVRSRDHGWRGSDRLRRKAEAPSPRAAWMALIAAACALDPERALAQRPKNDFALDFAHQVVCAPPLPLADYSAQQTAKAFLELARGLCETTTPERRVLLAEALKALAKALDGLLHEDARALAGRAWLDAED